MVFRIIFWLALAFLGLLEFKTIKGDTGCKGKNKNYTACAVMLYTKWTPCNGTDCKLGLQKRFKGICCPSPSENTTVIKEACKRNCNISDSDFYELSIYMYIPPSTILTSRSSSPGINKTITSFPPTTLARALSSITKPLPFSRTSSVPSKTHGSTIPSTFIKIRGSTIQSALGKALDSTVVSAIYTATVKGLTTSSRETKIKGSHINTFFVEPKLTRGLQNENFMV